MSRHDTLYRFTLRLWTEELGDGRIEWRGQMQHMMNGESFYFRNWETLLDLLQRILPYVGEGEDERDKPSHLPEIKGGTRKKT